MSKIIVTGGAGFIGSNLVDALIVLGHEVHIIDNLSAGKQENVNPKAILHIVDIRQKGELISILKGAKYVFHEAAMPAVQYSIENPIETNDVNVNGLLNVLEACRVSKVERLIFASSCAVYGDQSKMPLVESMQASPLSPYAVHKYIGEIYCKLYFQIYDLETVCLRYFNVYGPRQNPQGTYPLVIAKFLDFKKQNKPLTITGDGKQTRDYVHVRDVVRANILAMQSEKVGRAEVINIGGKNKISVNQIAELIGGPVEYIPPRIELHDAESDNIKAKELLAWEPSVSIEDGISELKKINAI